jgi:DNA polymerase-3 subunit gamma/tau
VPVYIPLHHKYRPQTFAQLVGQEVIRTTLSQGVRLGRIAPAYLFTGPRGTGKTSSARILAKALNCQSTHQPTPEPCGVCALCQAIAKGNALDIIEIDAASHTGVDNVREMIEKAQFAPVQARYKVFIIDECHMLSGAAFNALLKTLEEPPERVVFVLATTDPQRVPATIISRCQRFDFRRIPQADIEAHLRRIADQEGIAITPAALTLVAQLAQGGLRDAESLLDQLSLLPPPIEPEQVWQLAGRVPERDLWDLVQAIYSEPLVSVLQRGRALLERGWEPLHLYQQLVGFVRDGLIALTAPQARHLTTLMADTWQAWQTLGKRVTATDLLQAQEYLRQSEPQLRHTTQPHLWLEVTLLGWWHLWHEKITSPPTGTPASQPTTPSSQPSTTHTPSAITVPKTPLTAPTIPVSEPAAAPASVSHRSTPAIQTSLASTSSPQDLATLWTQVVSHIKKPPARSLFQDASLVKLENQHAEVALKSPALLRNAQGKLKELQAAFQEVLAAPITVHLIVAPKGEPATMPPLPPGPASPSATSQETPKHPPSPDVIREDQVMIAARRLANFFQGEVIIPPEETEELEADK